MCDIETPPASPAESQPRPTEPPPEPEWPYRKWKRRLHFLSDYLFEKVVDFCNSIGARLEKVGWDYHARGWYRFPEARWNAETHVLTLHSNSLGNQEGVFSFHSNCDSFEVPLLYTAKRIESSTQEMSKAARLQVVAGWSAKGPKDL